MLLCLFLSVHVPSFDNMRYILFPLKLRSVNRTIEKVSESLDAVSINEQPTSKIIIRLRHFRLNDKVDRGSENSIYTFSSRLVERRFRSYDEIKVIACWRKINGKSGHAG